MHLRINLNIAIGLFAQVVLYFKEHEKVVKLSPCEMWRVTSTDMERLDVFHRKCLRRILGIFWPYTISNRDLYERAREIPISETLKVRRWRWIGRVLRREEDNNCRVALTWTPEGQEKAWKTKDYMEEHY